MKLTNEQELGLKLAKQWWSSVDKFSRPFVINGYAGCGKSTLVSHIIEALDIPYYEVRFVTFTGSASSVLTAKGNPATTIHRLIYNPKVGSNNTVYFELKEELGKDIRLIIVDEYSQVSSDLMADLETFKIPIILLGDPAQHRPFKATANRYMNHYDVILTNPMRQALDNPIIALATDIRNGKPLKVGTMGDSVFIVPKEQIQKENIEFADIIIAPSNATVDYYNNYVRKDIWT